VERLMGEMGITGVVRGRRPVRTTIADPAAQRPSDLVDRQFQASHPNQLWVADFTYCPTWAGMVYVAFVFDVFSRRILGWRAATRMTTPLVLDCLEHALWTRQRDGVSDLSGLVHHTDAGSQYTSIAFTDRLVQAGIDAAVGSIGNAYDNALAESQIGLFKADLIHRHGSWRDRDHLEAAVLEWVAWFNTERPPRIHRRPHPGPGGRSSLPISSQPRRGRLTPNEASGNTGAGHFAALRCGGLNFSRS
jgi:putative transposase